MASFSSILTQFVPTPPLPFKDSSQARYLKAQLQQIASVIGLIEQVVTELDETNNIFTVAKLPAVAIKGQRAFVTDASSPTFLGTLTGGSSTFCPVFFNGTHWLAG